jgi:hypothetical protein
VVTYEESQFESKYENGLLTYATELAFGDLHELLKDIGIFNHNLETFNSTERDEHDDDVIGDDDENIATFMNSRYTMIDMTDYENDFPGYNEVGDDVPIMNPMLAASLNDEMTPGATIAFQFDFLTEAPKYFNS